MLGGHCMGGMVAFEMARTLVAAGEAVPLVALIDVPAPRTRVEVLRAAYYRGARRIRGDEEGADGGRSPQEILGARLGEMARDRYRGGPYGGRVALFVTTRYGTADHPMPPDDRVERWRSFAPDLRVRVVEGPHHLVVREPMVSTVAGVLREYLDALGP